MVSKIIKISLLCVGLLLVAIWTLTPRLIGNRSHGSLAACKSNLKNLGTAMEMYSTDWNGQYPRNLQILTPNYLKTIPECPAVHRITYKMTTGANAPFNESGFHEFYLIECTGTAHTDTRVDADYPKYTATHGLLER